MVKGKYCCMLHFASFRWCIVVCEYLIDTFQGHDPHTLEMKSARKIDKNLAAHLTSRVSVF